MKGCTVCSVPLHHVGPVAIIGSTGAYEVMVPLATYESPLWASVRRGALVTRRAGGIRVVCVKDCMTRSILIEAQNLDTALQIIRFLEAQPGPLVDVVTTTSAHIHQVHVHHRLVGSCVFIRIEAHTEEASGHNMLTKAADAVLHWLLQTFPGTRHISVSGNYCVDKKVSSVNAILGRGKSMVAEVVIPHALCHKVLSITPEAVVEVNTKKNLLGSLINGGVQSANAHVANMLLALYLATGQDGANIVEGSQGITFAEVRGQDLYLSVSLPNIIVGTVGNGKHLPSTRAALEALGCLGPASAVRLAEIAAGTVLCGEINLLAVQACPGALVRSHLALERGGSF